MYQEVSWRRTKINAEKRLEEEINQVRKVQIKHRTEEGGKGTILTQRWNVMNFEIPTRTDEINISEYEHFW